MVLASELREVMALQLDLQVYKALEVEAKTSTAKNGRHSLRQALKSAHRVHMEPALSAIREIGGVELEKRKLEFLYSDGSNCVFRRRDSCHARERPGIKVPLFVASGEIVSVDLKTGRYVGRIRPQQRREV